MMNQKKEVWGIILGAGLSSRMGSPKLLLPFKGKSIIQHVIQNALSSNLDGLIVVINPQIPGVYEEVRLNHVNKVILNDRAEQGMSSSIKAGLQALPNYVNAAVMLLGDQPQMSDQMINRVINKFHQRSSSIVQASYNGERSHPVLFKRDMFLFLYQISGDFGGKSVIKQLKREVELVEMDSTIVPDIDTPKDYNQLISEECC